MSHFHYRFILYDSQDQMGNFQNVTDVDIMADNLEHAWERIKKLNKKEKKAHLRNITEHHDDHES